MKSVFIIIPVHNRRQKTLNCLAQLQNTGCLDNYEVVIIDDGSIDGTGEAVEINYPQVKILRGDGNLWWTGGIKKGMEYVYSQGAEYFLWLNDDCTPGAGTIETLLSLCQTHSNSIAAAQVIDPDTGAPTYGGFLCGNGQIVPVDAAENDRYCDALNGNLVCFPRRVIDDIGYPDARLFPHYHGDTTYTRKAHKAGYELLLVKEAIAFGKNDHAPVSWVNPPVSVMNYWQDYFHIKSPYYWKADLAHHIYLLGYRGFFIYLWNRILKFSLISLFVAPLPKNVRLQLQQIYRKLKKQPQLQ
ncbi:MAG: hypothetical protein N5P05_003578 [Chroococcopsis gigantea SAG 12.99]|jgi:GT2 family glycosyltransferase|nr:hypothetical protein [Chroococcopsis gigantea SAG 12.99]